VAAGEPGRTRVIKWMRRLMAHLPRAERDAGEGTVAGGAGWTANNLRCARGRSDAEGGWGRASFDASIGMRSSISPFASYGRSWDSDFKLQDVGSQHASSSGGCVVVDEQGIEASMPSTINGGSRCCASCAVGSGRGGGAEDELIWTRRGYRRGWRRGLLSAGGAAGKSMGRAWDKEWPCFARSTKRSAGKWLVFRMLGCVSGMRRLDGAFGSVPQRMSRGGGTLRSSRDEGRGACGCACRRRRDRRRCVGRAGRRAPGLTHLGEETFPFEACAAGLQAPGRRSRDTGRE